MIQVPYLEGIDSLQSVLVPDKTIVEEDVGILHTSQRDFVLNL